MHDGGMASTTNRPAPKRPVRRRVYVGMAGVGIVLGAASLTLPDPAAGGSAAAATAHATAAASALSDHNFERELTDERGEESDGDDHRRSTSASTIVPGDRVGAGAGEVVVRIEVDSATGVVEVRLRSG